MRFRFGWDEEDDACVMLKLLLLHLIRTFRICGVTQFMTACDPGVGLWCAELINLLRDGDEELHLYCVEPHEGHSAKWAPYLRHRYFKMLEKCTFAVTLKRYGSPASQLYAYEYIIKKSDIVLAVYDPSSARGDDVDRAMDYAQALKRPAILVHPDTLDVRLITERCLYRTVYNYIVILEYIDYND
jgi:uncharacterized phage-like protein YoqJ